MTPPFPAAKADFEKSVTFINDRGDNDLKMSDAKRLELYALFKQASFGDLPASLHKPNFLQIVARTKYDAWNTLKGLSKMSAMEEYAALVASMNAGFQLAPTFVVDTATGIKAPSSITTTRRPSMLTATPPTTSFAPAQSQVRKKSEATQKADNQLHPLEDSNYAIMDKTQLLTEIDKLNIELFKLKAFRVYKEGNLSRMRETLTGEDWSVRYFEIKPGSLKCYKSYEDRILRASIPLFDAVSATAAHSPSSTHSSHEYVISISLTPTKNSSIKFLTMAATDLADAQEWCDAIISAGRDGGTAPKLLKAGDDSHPQKKEAHDLSLKDVHKKHQSSFLSSDNPDRQSYRGVFNLVLIVCVVSNMGAIVNSAIHNGNMLAKVLKIEMVLEKNEYVVVVLGSLSLPAFILLAYFIEAVSKTHWVSTRLSKLLHFINVSASLLFPCGLTSVTNVNPAVGGPFVFLSTVLFLKLASYAHTNIVLRERWLSGSGKEDSKLTKKSGIQAGSVPYPQNISMKDILRFICFPTLCYQTSYPRTNDIRPKWVIKRVVELLLTLITQFVIFQQFMIPGLAASQEARNAGEYLSAFLSLAIPSLGCWLCMFYALFHLWLNILSELTYFGDRQFYKAWWNATKLDVYWRNWNIPVHSWLVRHVFFPCMNLGCSKNVSVFMVFTASALLHEVLVSVPFHTSQAYAFAGMMAQIPLIAATNFTDKKLNGSQFGNFIFWLSFCIVGQPLCIMLYYHELMK